MNTGMGHNNDHATVEGPDFDKNRSRNASIAVGNTPLSKIDTMKYELTMLKQPVGQSVAEHVIKKNHINYELYYPEKANAYLPPKDKPEEEKLMEEL